MLDFIKKHLFIIYLTPVIIFITFYSKLIGLDNCNAVRTKEISSSYYIFLDPQYFSVIFSLFIVALASFRYYKRFIIMSTVIIDFLNAYIFHRSIYYIICIIKIPLNDRNCNIEGVLKYNSISGHYFTIIYFFGVLIRLIKTIPYQPKTIFSVISLKNTTSVDNCGDWLGPFGNRTSLIHYGKETIRYILAFVVLIVFMICSYFCMYDTLIKGYHSPRQLFYGVISGITSLFLYYAFLKISFLYQSLFNFIFYSVSYMFACAVLGYHVTFNGYFITSIISLIISLTHGLLSTQSYDIEE